MVCSIQSLGLSGIEPFLVSVEVDARKGLPGFEIVGLPDAAVRESRERVRAAMQNLGYPSVTAKVVANLAPAGTRKQGAVYDLPILLALLGATGHAPCIPHGTAVIGEIGLSGELRRVDGVLPMVLDAQALGLERVIVPASNAAEAAVARGVEVLCAAHVSQILSWLRGEETLPVAEEAPPLAPSTLELDDLRDVKGQHEARHALEIAAAGGHNLMLIGAPGAGKSMLARRLPSILPAMTRPEAIEATKVYSVAGLLEAGHGLLQERPFRAPHHSASVAALVGGGSHPSPGEISLAHNGVLFLDELPEFQKNALESLRQPIEDGNVSINRVQGRVRYPSHVMLLAAMNPCPCGFYGHPTRACTCNPNTIQRYLGRISGPLLDRIDLQVEVLPVEYQQIASSTPGESSADVRARVAKTREIQTTRYAGTSISCNAALTAALLEETCPLESAARKVLQAAFDRLGLSARGYTRILKVARTVADMAAAETIAAEHVAQAVQLRSLDRKYWSGG